MMVTNGVMKLDIPEEHENEMSHRSPTCTYNLEPGVCSRSVHLEFSCQLRDTVRRGSLQQVIVQKKHTIANSRTWMVAPAAYHHGPEIPYLYATALDCSYKSISKCHRPS